jgi:hypothetical protein
VLPPPNSRKDPWRPEIGAATQRLGAVQYRKAAVPGLPPGVGALPGKLYASGRLEGLGTGSSHITE